MTTGVVLMTYGAPSDAADVPRYLTAVRGGTEPGAELVAEMARRYAVIGGSPLVAMTERQAASLERALGPDHRVRGGMRFSEPSIACAIDALLAAGAERVVGICLSPQWSDGLMAGYERAARAALASRPDAAFAMPHAWHREPEFIDALAGLVRDALQESPPGESTGSLPGESRGFPGESTALERSVPVVFTAHSLPKRICDAEPGYVAQLRETAELVAARMGLAPDRWHWAYQSAGHTAEEWLRPDLSELFPDLAAAGHRSVLVAPVQFLSDHLEVLYDLDIAAAAQAHAAGLEYRRIAMPNTDPRFIAALAAIVRCASTGF